MYMLNIKLLPVSLFHFFFVKEMKGLAGLRQQKVKKIPQIIKLFWDIFKNY